MQWETLTYRNIPWDELELEQKRLIDSVRANPTVSFLMVSEPQSVFTHGRSADNRDLLWNTEQLEKSSTTVARVARGGKWTYHGPGQLLVYPIVSLPALGYHSKAARAFVEALRAGVLAAVTELGITDCTSGEPFGLYVRQNKLASFGLNFSGGIASSGVALYCENQTKFFEGINPCGVKASPTISLSECLANPPPWPTVANCMTKHIKNHLSLGVSQVL